MKENIYIHWSEYALKHTYQHANDNIKLYDEIAQKIKTGTERYVKIMSLIQKKKYQSRNKKKYKNFTMPHPTTQFQSHNSTSSSK